MDHLNELKKPGLGFGVQGPLRRYNQDQRVRITRGKNKGRTATVSYEADPHPCRARDDSICIWTIVARFGHRTMSS